jgi:hypothetical protein
MRIPASILAAAALAACAPGNGNQLSDGRDGKPPLPPVGPVSPPPPPASPGGDRCDGAMDYEHCVDFLPAERMHGVWVTGFEQSSYVSNATAAPAVDDPERHRTWLTFADGRWPNPAFRAELDKMRSHMAVAVAIEFDGRRARGPGNGYGHLNGAQNLVIVDRIVSIRILGPLARP